MQKKIILIALILSAFCWAVLPAAGQEKYAVLISTGKTTSDDTYLNSEYWYDLVLTYHMLIENNFTHDNIYVLYGDGTDYFSSHTDYQNPYPQPMTDYAVSRKSIQNIFSWLAAGNASEGIPALTSNDYLFIWWMGHGGGGSSCNTILDPRIGTPVTDTELATWTGAVSYRKRAFVFMTCHSGGVLDNLANTTTVATTSCACNELSSSGLYDVVHGQWTYLVDGALRQLLPGGTTVPSEADGNNLVSLQETFDWASAQPMTSTPQLGDPGSIAPCTFIKLDVPGADTEIFSMDHTADDGTVPSTLTGPVWYHGPDLWVRNLNDGLPTHQEPYFGIVNYVYANVHNIGCGTVTNTTVDFSWVEPSGWSNPASWNNIATRTILSLAPLTSATVHAPWAPMLPGDVCLHTRLNVAGDLENASGMAFMDNNKVQINVDVQTSWAGLSRLHSFFIENGSTRPEKVDLIFRADHPDFRVPVEIGLPPELDFEEVAGAGVTLSDNDWMLLRSSSEEKQFVEVKGVMLEPGEKHRAFIRITTPENARRGQEASVLFEERVNGEMVGGIQFVHRAAEREVVIAELMQHTNAVFSAIHEVLEVPEAQAVAQLSKELLRSGKLGNEALFFEKMDQMAVNVRQMGAQMKALSPVFGEQFVQYGEQFGLMTERVNLEGIMDKQDKLLQMATVILSEKLKEKDEKFSLLD